MVYCIIVFFFICLRCFNRMCVLGFFSGPVVMGISRAWAVFYVSV